MKLSKAKKLFKAGEIQILNDCDKEDIFRAVTGWWSDYQKGGFDYTWQHSSSARTREGRPVIGKKIIKLSEIKPSKKESLKKQVKAMSDALTEVIREVSQINPGGASALFIRTGMFSEYENPKSNPESCCPSDGVITKDQSPCNTTDHK